MVRRTPPDIEALVVKDYNDGMKYKDIHSKYRFSHSTIDSILKRNENKIVRRSEVNTPLIRFLSDSWDENSIENCFIWKKKKFRNGYGAFEVLGRNYLAHRVMYEFYYGYKPERHEVVMHKCDNPSCVNPFHLELGSQKDNIQDMLKKRRAANGEKSGKNILLEADVLEIRKSKDTQISLARKYGVSRSTIYMIKYNKNWKHI